MRIHVCIATDKTQNLFWVHPPIAQQIVVLLVRGLMFKLEFQYAHFGTRSIAGDLIYPIVWDADLKLVS